MDFYPSDFSSVELIHFDVQLGNYIFDVHEDEEFSKLDEISALAVKLIAKRKHTVFTLVYLLVELTLILSVTTTIVESTFSTMNIFKTPLHNRIGDEFTNNYLMTYIEKNVFRSITANRIKH